MQSDAPDPTSRPDDAPEGPPDEQLVARVKEGDRAAFRLLVERYERRVLRLAVSRLRNEHEALDVCQEAFLKVHRNIDQFQGTSSFYTWLYRIVLNLCIDRARRAGRWAEVDFDEAAQNEASLPSDTGAMPKRFVEPDRAFESQEFWGEYGRALDGLSDKHRAVFQMHVEDGLSYKEIAAELDINLGTVMSRLHHARQNLQSVLRRYFKRK